MKEIPLTQKKVALVDDADYDRLVAVGRWTAARDHELEKFYAIHAWREDGRSRQVKMHRVILDAKTDQLVDHVDGDGLNNLRSNIRLCTHAQNCQNRAGRRGDGLRGVRFRRGCWYAEIKGRQIGRFDASEKAARAYDLEAIRLYGGFALLNFPR